MEWFDWGIYTIFAPFFASQFFHSGDQVSDVLSVLAVFAVGFIARPFGGLLVGWIADKKGRKLSMMLMVGLAALGQPRDRSFADLRLDRRRRVADPGNRPTRTGSRAWRRVALGANLHR